MDVCYNSFFCSADSEDLKEWTKIEFDLQPSESNSNSRLQLTTSKSGIIWFDQVSLMPSDTFMVIYFPLFSWMLAISFYIITEGISLLYSSFASTKVCVKHSIPVNIYSNAQKLFMFTMPYIQICDKLEPEFSLNSRYLSKHSIGEANNILLCN
jgi:hypothetical protein